MSIHNDMDNLLTDTENISILDTKPHKTKKTIKHEVVEKTQCDLIFMKKIDDIEDQYIESLNNLKKSFKNSIKELRHAYNNDINNLAKNKKKTSYNTGITKKNKIPLKLIKLLDLDPNVELSISEISHLVYEYLNAHNLVYEKDRRVMRVDKKLSDIFNIPISVNESTNYKDRNGFNLYTIQKYISNAIKNI